jgi:signal transduction histidine kinase
MRADRHLGNLNGHSAAASKSLTKEKPAATSPAGFLLMDSFVSPISFNGEAIRILSYPNKLANGSRLGVFLAGKIRSNLISQQPSCESPFVTEFQSGRRRYLCRAFPVNSHAKGPSHPSTALLLVRASSTDLEGNFTSINRAGKRLSGSGRQGDPSTNFPASVAPEHVAVARRPREAKLSVDKEGARKEGARHELEIPPKDGRPPPDEINTRLTYQEGVPGDIIEPRQTERAPRRLHELLEEEARRIAHALHDEAGQLLASVYLALAELAGDLPAPARKRLEQISVLLDHVGEQLRCLSHELRPAVLDDFGLVAALESLVQGVSKRTGLVITIDAALEDRLPLAVETALYRILQEVLSNVGRHAWASQVKIHLQRAPGMITCSVRDDGIGMDVSAVPQRGQGGLGLIGIRERLAALGGRLSITSRQGEGTDLGITIPLHL